MAHHCPYCEGVIPPNAQKCQHCGEWLEREEPPRAPGQVQNVYVQAPPSPLFAILTMVAYFFLYPVGFIMNVVGLFTGPKRGCFIAMFIVCFLIPVGLFVGLVVLGASPEFQKWLEDFVHEMEREPMR